MDHLMNFVVVPAVFCCLLMSTATATFWGDWGKVEHCPDGKLAIGFTLKTEKWMADEDDTALNGIALRCSGGSWITSSEGTQGNWFEGGNFICQSGGLTSCQLRVEPQQGNGDDTTANNLNCKCSSGETLNGDGTSWGEWNEWTKTCDNGICALQTRVQKPQGDGDDTGLNDVKFICCHIPAGILGDWGKVEFCPNEEYAVGFKLKTQQPQGVGDDTALNGIALKCSDGKWITSTVGPWGEWGKEFMCPNGTRITQCQLRVEPDQGDGDDTEANNLNCKCSNGETLFGDGTNWGSWNGWTTTCDKGICALQTRVEKPHENGDDTALNDVIFTCCPL